MRSCDILRGGFYASSAGVVLHVLALALLENWGRPLPTTFDDATMVIYEFFFIGGLATIIGAIISLPFLLFAHLFFKFLRAEGALVWWWSAPITVFILTLGLSTIVYPFDLLSPIRIGYAMSLGLVTGLAFWYGAAGWRSSVDLGNRSHTEVQ